MGSHWSSEALHRDGSFGVQARLISTVGILGSARSCTFGKTTTFNNELLSYFTWHKSRDKIRRPLALRGARFACNTLQPCLAQKSQALAPGCGARQSGCTAKRWTWIGALLHRDTNCRYFLQLFYRNQKTDRKSLILLNFINWHSNCLCI